MADKQGKEQNIHDDEPNIHVVDDEPNRHDDEPNIHHVDAERKPTWYRWMLGVSLCLILTGALILILSSVEPSESDNQQSEDTEEVSWDAHAVTTNPRVA